VFGKRLSIPVRATVSISPSVNPSPRGLGAIKSAYSPRTELRNGRMSSVWAVTRRQSRRAGRKIERRSRYERTYANGDGVIPFKVIPDRVNLELLHGFAPAKGPVHRTTRKWGRGKCSDRTLDVRQISMHVRRASTSSIDSLSKCVACPRRCGSQLKSCFVSAAEFSGV
jgi:hypothetical protein